MWVGVHAAIVQVAHRHAGTAVHEAHHHVRPPQALEGHVEAHEVVRVAGEQVLQHLFHAGGRQGPHHHLRIRPQRAHGAGSAGAQNAGAVDVVHHLGDHHARHTAGQRRQSAKHIKGLCVAARVVGFLGDDDHAAGLMGVGRQQVLRVLRHAVVVDDAGIHERRRQAISVARREQLHRNVGQRRGVAHMVHEPGEVGVRVLGGHVDDEQMVFHVSPLELAATAALPPQGAVVEEVRGGLRQQEDAEQIHAKNSGQPPQRRGRGEVAVAHGGRRGDGEPHGIAWGEALDGHHGRHMDHEQGDEQPGYADEATANGPRDMAGEAQVAPPPEPTD